jgi:PAT family beta-lactamase induction signal transducer AmpG
MRSLVETSRGRGLLYYLLYISEGAPIGFIWWTLPTLLAARHVPVDRIAELGAILVLPWSLKILWSPFMDVFQFKQWNLRHWIMLCQFMMGLTLLPLATLDFSRDFFFIRNLLVLHAVFAASQDVCIDSWAIKRTPENELGRINGFMQLGVMSGRWLFASGYLLLSAHFPQKLLIYTLVFVVWSNAIVVLLTKDSKLAISVRATFRKRSSDFVKKISQVLTKKATWAGIAFAAVAGTGFHGATAVLGPYLHDRGFTEAQTGSFFGFNLLATFVGSFIGGVLADKYGRRRMTFTFLVLTAASVLTIALVDQFFWSRTLGYALFQWLHVCIGLFTVSSYGMLMEITDHEVSATQFSTFMGAVNICESWTSTAFAAAFRVYKSYAINFALFACISLIALFLYPALRKIHSNKRSLINDSD